MSRLNFEKKNNYSNKVLVGDWWINRTPPEKPVIEENMYVTTTSQDFSHKKLKPDDTISKSLLWERKLRNEGVGILPKTATEEFPNYNENYCSLYDLSYNHIPKWKQALKPNIKGKIIDIPPDLSFGNITHTGSTEYNKSKWDQDLESSRYFGRSLYESTFVPPDKEDYEREKRIIAKIDGKPVQLFDPPGSRNFSPITWQCMNLKS